MTLRAEVIGMLFKKYGGEQIQEAVYSTEDIYNCAHDWVSHGNQTIEGVLDYFNKRFIENMALSERVSESLSEAESAIRNALVFAARNEKSIVCSTLTKDSSRY